VENFGGRKWGSLKVPIKTPKAIGKNYKASVEVIHRLSMVVDNYTL
jgi:hypothetical protein